MSSVFPSNLLLFGAGTKHTTNRNTLLLKSFCVTRKKWRNHVGEHESIDSFHDYNTKCRETVLEYAKLVAARGLQLQQNEHI